MRNNGGGSVSCTPCPTGLVQSEDGWNCVSVQICNQPTSFLSDTDITGAYFLNNSVAVRSCIQCDATTLATSSGCISCYPLVYTDDTTINIQSLICSTECKISGGMCLHKSNSPPTIYLPNDFTIPVGTNSATSWFLTEYASNAYYQCRNATNRNATACQLLLNMCTLIYNVQASSSATMDVCRSYRSIARSTGLPILDLYQTNFGNYQTYSQTQVSLYLTYNNSVTTCQSNDLSFVAAKYRLNGSLISYSTLDLSELELCNLFNTGEARPSSSSFIAINYVQTCTVSISKLMQLATKEPIFYDLYLRYKLTNGSYALITVPTVVLNYLELGVEVNSVGGSKSRLSHRFFLVDQYTTKSTQSGSAQYIRYASSILLQFNMYNDNTNSGRMYPPTLYITYDYASTTSNANSSVSPSFTVNYSMDLTTPITNVWISIGVLSFFGLLWSVIRTWIWNKRSGKITLDIVTIFKFLMYLCNSIANVFFVVFVGACIWWLIFFKGQNLAYILLPTTTQQDTFTALLIVAFVLKVLDIIHLIFVQVSFDVFVMDWEKPKVETGLLLSVFIFHSIIACYILGKKGSVSCWRTLFVANEWNEIQTFRKTNLTIQLVFTLLFLKVVNLEAICTADCNTTINQDLNKYTAAYSSVLRVGMAASIYIAIGKLTI